MMGRKEEGGDEDSKCFSERKMCLDAGDMSIVWELGFLSLRIRVFISPEKVDDSGCEV